MPRTLGQAIGFLFGFWLVLALSPLVVKTAAANELDQLSDRLFTEVNRARAERHLVALERRADLDGVALAHSQDMVRRGYFSHHTPEGANPLDRLIVLKIAGMTLGAENLGKTTEAEPTRQIVTNWLASRDHRRNLLAPAFNFTGVGVAHAADGALVYTQVYIAVPR
jgi:uncharacterized protein YkwD